MPWPVINVRGVKKHFGPVIALKGVDLQIFEGEAVAILGPNGAGKTTLIETLIGLSTPDEGVVHVLGCDVLAHPRGPHLQRLGVQLQDARMFPQVKVQEILDLFATFYEHPVIVDQLIQEMGLDSQRNKKIVDLSGGWRQRVRLALALVNDPKLVLLDEPSVGLDPIARDELWQTLARTRNATRTLLVTTHYMDEARRLADKIIIIAGGQIVAVGSPEQLILDAGSGIQSLDDAYINYVRVAGDAR
jgi:ABC-2 type transport system ATP-binding protein